MWNDKLKSKFRELLKRPYALPILLFMAGAVILTLISNIESTPTKEHGTYVDPDEYVSALEKSLEKHIKKLDNVESCNVMITVSSVKEKEYLENTTVSSDLKEGSEQYDRQREYLVIDSGGGDQVIAKSELMPEICGALVIYHGNDDINTQAKILDAVSTVLGIQSNKVCVVSN